MTGGTPERLDSLMLAELLKPVGDRAVVTGAGSGIGRLIALYLAAGGVEVWALGRRLDPLAETAAMAEPGSVHPVQADIRDPETVNAAFTEAEAAGPVEVVVNAASGAFLAPAEKISPNGFAAVVGSSLNGPFHVLRRWAVPLLDAGVAGTALVVSSALAAREVPGAAHSSAAKAGLEALVRSLAVEWGPRGLRVNALAPGAFATEGASAGMWSDERVRTSTLEAIPMGRFGGIDELVLPAAFLLAAGSSYLTGVTLTVDGGWHLSRHPFGQDYPARQDHEKRVTA